ncbi:MAG: dTMP kinase [Patescibacteria group bacterium]|nr:dTMP kinase [Patescibacteria group bacterium]
MDFPGKYVVLEGPDYAGKDVQCGFLINALEKEGHEVVFIREPGTGWLGDGIRKILLDKKSDLVPTAEMLLFMANRAQILKEFILPCLKEGKIVISSRDRLSTLSYQGYGRGLSLEMIKLIGNFAMEKVLPDLYIILMASLDVLMQRKGVDTDRIESESLEFHERVLRGYQDFIVQNPEITAVFDAGLSREKIHSQILESVKRVLE